jgi:hypothetical protein
MRLIGASTTLGRNRIFSPAQLRISAGSTNPIQFHTAAGTNVNSDGNVQLAITNTASAVNYAQVTGAATGGAPTFSSQGSDTNINMSFVSKGSGGFRFFSQAGGARQFQINNTASAVNYPVVTGAITGAGPVYSVDGTDTNIDLALTPKGTGNVRFGTFTADMTLVVQGFIEVKDSGGTIRKLAVIA